MLYGIRLSNLASARNILVLYIHHYNILMASICTDLYCVRPSALLGLFLYESDLYCVRPSALLGLFLMNQICTVLGLQLCWGYSFMYRSGLC